MANRRAARVVTALGKEAGVTVEPGWGEGNVVLKHRAKMFVIVRPEDVVAKLPKPRVDDLVEAGKGSRFDPRKNGRVMKEWLVVTEAPMWLSLAREALACVSAAKRMTAVRSR